MALTTVNPGLLDTQAQYTGFKNRIINGAMVINQRNLGTVNPTSGDALKYTIDRVWVYNSNASSKFSVQQSSTAPAGFINSALITVTNAYTPTGGDEFEIGQYIEGLNVADLGWGTANAQSVTLSFWVRSSVTGTFGGSLVNSGYNRSYPFNYTISSANTWEQKSVTIAGDTSGTWLTTNGVGIRLQFSLGVGSTKTTTANAWTAGEYYNSTGSVNLVATAGATFYITGVQLEKGSTATSFDYRPYGTELQLCQRYFYNATPNNPYGFLTMGATLSTTSGSWQIPLPVPMRTTPTFSYSGAIVIKNLGSVSVSSFAGPYGTAAPCNSVEGDFTCASTTSGAAAFINFNNSGKLATFSAEL